MKKVFVFMILVLTVGVVQGQKNDRWLRQADSCLKAGDCECAEGAYEAYRDLKGGRDKQIERRIADCKKENASTDEYVDLGLQSGTLWKSTNEKSTDETGFFWIGDALAFGNSLPSEGQWEELLDSCTWQWTGKGYKVEGSNGQSIFLPAEGYYDFYSLGETEPIGTFGVGLVGAYWSSTQTGAESYAGIEMMGLSFEAVKPKITQAEAYEALSVRLVKRKPDYSFYFKAINISLTNGDCESARRLYNEYKAESGLKDVDIEKRLSGCKTGGEKTPVQIPGFVDLGLPSGLLWKEKNEGNKDLKLFTFDFALNKCKNSLPDTTQWGELIKICRWVWTENGYKIIGPNGNSILLPADGFWSYSPNDYYGSFGRYWAFINDTTSSSVIFSPGDIENDAFSLGESQSIRRVCSPAWAAEAVNMPRRRKTRGDNGYPIAPISVEVGDVTFSMVYVKGDSSLMGAQYLNPSAANYDLDAFDSEGPVHSVTLNSYYIGETEVTQALWKAVMGNNPSEFRGDSLPVTNVNYEDVQEFIVRLNQLTGHEFRLPTSAEWEFAARGGRKSRGYKYSGSNKIEEVAWFEGNSDSKSHSVKSKQPNELGLYDMSGNVWEWCSDWQEKYSSGEQTNPQGAVLESTIVVRGGSWNNYSGEGAHRVAYRAKENPTHRHDFIGFRLAMVK